jgi:mRNA interferase MazF
VVDDPSSTEVRRGTLWWVDLAPAEGSAPGFRRPAVVVQADAFNRSRIGTVIVALLTSHLHLADAPGNVLIRARESRLAKDSVINVSQLYTVDRAMLTQEHGHVSARTMSAIDAGLRLVLDLHTP